MKVKVAVHISPVYHPVLLIRSHLTVWPFTFQFKRPDKDYEFYKRKLKQ